MVGEPGAPDPTPTEPAYRLHVGTVLSDTIDVWMGNFAPFTIVALIVSSPSLLTPFVLPLFVSPAPAGVMVAVGAWESMVLTNLLRGIVAFGVFEQLGGRRTSVGAMLGIGLSRAVAILLVATVVGAATMVGTLLLVVPGLIVSCTLWLAVPVAVVERGGVAHACNRSIELTRGNRWTVLGVIAVIAVSSELLNYGLRLVTPMSGLSPLLAVQLTALGRDLAAIPFHLLSAIAAAVAYHDLRVHRESIDTDDLIAVFE